MAKMCILLHWGVQLLFAYIWAGPAFLIAGEDRGGMFFFILFLHVHYYFSFLPVPLFHLLYYLFFPFLWEMRQNDPQGHVNKPQHNQKQMLMHGMNLELCIFWLFKDTSLLDVAQMSGPSCSKLMMSLVNEMLKFTWSDLQIC